MSWDAYLLCDCCGCTILDQNYTHNCNGMVDGALRAAGFATRIIDYDPPRHVYTKADGWHDEAFEVASWWMHLDGLTGPAGSQMLDVALVEMATHPDIYRAMNPENGWGDFDSFVDVLTRMRDAGMREHPCTWRTSG